MTRSLRLHLVLTGFEIPLWLILFVLKASPDMTHMSGLYLGVFVVTTLTIVLTRPPDLLRTLDTHLGAALLCALPLVWLSS